MVYRERNLDGDLELCTAFYYKPPVPQLSCAYRWCCTQIGLVPLTVSVTSSDCPWTPLSAQKPSILSTPV